MQAQGRGLSSCPASVDGVEREHGTRGCVVWGMRLPMVCLSSRVYVSGIVDLAARA